MKTAPRSNKALSVIALLLMLAAPSAFASEQVDTLWVLGTEAYADGDWQSAIDSWQAIADEGYVSPVLDYNLGNAYFKSGNLGRAILNYERAVKADPSFTDARYNLEFANSFIQRKTDVVPEFLLKSWFRKVCYIFKSDVWAVLSILFFAGACLLALGFFFAAGAQKRKRSFIGAIAALVLFGITLSFALWQNDNYVATDSAIVLSPVASVKNSPAGGSSATDIIVLHEGVKVKVLDTVGQYTQIEISSGNQGWILTSDIEVI